jgi:hypothetical protein
LKRGVIASLRGKMRMVDLHPALDILSTVAKEFAL